MEAFKIIIYIILLLLSLYLAFKFTTRRALRTDVVSLVYKTAASACFIALGVEAFWACQNAASLSIILGLVMGLIGDIYLDLKYMYPKNADIYTFVGFAAFMFGHVFYLMFMFHQYNPVGNGIWISALLGLAVGAFIYYCSARFFRLEYGKFRLISAVYAGLLMFVTSYSAFVCFSGFTASKLIFFLGLILFYISDFILSRIYFGKNMNTPKNSMLNHGNYYLGQIFISASIMFII